MKPQLCAMANTVRERKGPPPIGKPDNYNHLLEELKLDIPNIPRADQDDVEEFCVQYLDALSQVRKGKS